MLSWTFVFATNTPVALLTLAQDDDGSIESFHKPTPDEAFSAAAERVRWQG